ncbi:MAG: hypothetical protein LUB63_06865 [Oscillospiraceae bacterium]|nr:hypothetical protein [Oscillospiraceae bacterium]
MKNTDLFYKIIKDYREGIEEINAHFEPEYKWLERFNDSEYYPSKKEETDRRREKQIAGLRAQKLDSLGACIDMMGRSYLSKPMAAPDDAQLRLLTALQMRESLTADEIRQAAVTLKGCPAATGVLRELAQKNRCSLALDKELAGGEVQRGIDSLKRNAEAFISRIDRLDDEAQRSRLNQGREYGLFRLAGETAVSDKSECLRIFGNVTDCESFSAAVDGE